jgi:OmpA family protein
MVQVSVLPLVVWLVGCSGPKPVLYPNDHYKSVGQDTAKQDIEECRTMAKELGTAPGAGKGGAVARQTAVGAGVGAASGAVGGAIVGSAGTGAAVGAASGAAAGVLFGLFSGSGGPDPTYANIVNRCLAERGYEVAGWK